MITAEALHVQQNATQSKYLPAVIIEHQIIYTKLGHSGTPAIFSPLHIIIAKAVLFL